MYILKSMQKHMLYDSGRPVLHKIWILKLKNITFNKMDTLSKLEKFRQKLINKSQIITDMKKHVTRNEARAKTKFRNNKDG